MRRAALLALSAGLALTALAGLGGVAAVIGAWLAQPAFALAVRAWRGTDLRADTWRRDAGALLVLWGLAGAGIAVLVAWPLSALLQNRALGAALGVSAVAGVGLIGLWRTWPLWHAVEREGGRLGAHWHALVDADAMAWRGLAAALAVALVIASALLLAWPGVLAPTARWIFAGACALAWPLAHGILQRLDSPARHAVSDDLLHAAAHAPADDAALHDGDPDAALFAAAHAGRVDRALALLDAGADAHALPPNDARDQRTLPMLAAVLPDLRLLRALIGRGIDLNAAHAGMTPLLAATRDSWHGRPEAVMTLLANGADPRAVDADGNTPLHHAARSSDPGVAALLRDAGADIDVLNNDAVTPLGIACAAGNWRLARFLLERGAKPEPPAATPALLAAAGGDEDDAAGVQLLLKHKAKVDARDRAGRTALHEAAHAGHPDIIGVLLGAGADVQALDARQRTPLLEAARGARLAALDALAVARPDARALDADGRNALVLASLADAPSPALIRRLLELGVDADAADRDGRRALDHAAAAGRWALVAALDPGHALPSNLTDGGEGAPASDEAPPARAPLALLRDALDEGRVEAFERLRALVSPNDLGTLLRNQEGAPSAPAALDWLLAHGADADVRTVRQTQDGVVVEDSALFDWLARGPTALAAVQALLRRGVSPAGAGGLARFLAGCVTSDQGGRGLEQFALELLERGADPFAASPGGDPPLALAVRLGWMRLLDRLLAHGVALDARDIHGMTALHLAAALGRETALKRLVAYGASPDLRAADGQTALGVALSAGRRDLADWLDWRGWALPRRALQPADVPAAAIVGDADAVRRLLDLGLPVDTVDAQGCTALLRAAGGGHRATVDLLLARGADPQLAAHTGATPLSAAVSMRQGEIVERLIEAGATLEQRLPGEVTVLMLAAALGLPDLCARLLTAGANVHAADAQGLTPLHCAALYGFTARERPRLVALIDTLLLAGAEPDAVAAGGVTPLLLLLGARAEPGSPCDEDVVFAGLNRLLDEDASLQAQDPRGFGPLHLAALHGLLRITQFLLRAGAEPELRDALNRTPREIAVMRGFIDVASEFTPMPAAAPSMARFLREPR